VAVVLKRLPDVQAPVDAVIHHDRLGGTRRREEFDRHRLQCGNERSAGPAVDDVTFAIFLKPSTDLAVEAIFPFAPRIC
jgi:hypothetical protein